MKKLLLIVLCLAFAPPCLAMAEDDPILLTVMIDEFEIRRTHGNAEFAWDLEAWVGRDIDKVWIKTEGERADGDTRDSEFQALYSRAVTPYWNLQLGWRGDAKPGRDWAVVGLQGLAPYFVEIDANLFVGGSGNTALRVNAEREFLLTQRWVIAPAIEINAYAEDDAAAARGSGISDVETTLQIRYRIRPDFSPYAGLRWRQIYGESRGLVRGTGGDTSELQFLIGLNAWF